MDQRCLRYVAAEWRVEMRPWFRLEELMLDRWRDSHDLQRYWLGVDRRSGVLDDLANRVLIIEQPVGRGRSVSRMAAS